MRKKIILLLCILLLASGCEIINQESLGTIIPTLFEKETKLSNQVFEGYKFYLPKGMTLLNKNDYNMTLKDGNGNYYYLYVDVISYYHKEKVNYQERTGSDVYASQPLSYRGKKGYLEITKVNDAGIYFLEEMFQYAKIEAYVREKDLQDAVVLASSILNSVQYNDKVLETLVGENILHYKEETFSILKPKGQASSNYDTYLQVDKFIDKEHELPEEDKIELEDETK